MDSSSTSLLRPFSINAFISPKETKYEAVEKSTFKKTHRPQSLWFICFNVGLFFIYFGFFAYSARNMILHPKEKGLIYSPARSYVSYEKRTLDSSIPNDFSAPPRRREADKAWHQLLTYNNLVVSAEDLVNLDRTSVPLADGSGYLASLSVFHQLHCLNYIREFAFPDYYIQEVGQPRRDHIFHCIDNIRKIIQCHGDITPRTFEWTDSDRKPVMKPRSTHECRKWEPIVEFASKHNPAMGAGPFLVNPSLGPIYPHAVNESQA
ncbi:hypothetical protein BJ166DRAFT_356263 [Pestalotiopsis sp. NC0098]|nr:hypothetical protein BJ166DRAFT_356263 [Pestalotiopsis sp. NC0098]